MRLWITVLFSFFMMLITPLCRASDGVCHPTNGTANIYNLNLNGVKIPAEKNKSGTEARDLDVLKSSGKYKAHCDCLTHFTTLYSDIYYTARSPLSINTTRSGYTYYTLNNNLSIATSIHVQGRGYVAVPFEGQENNQVSSGYCFTSATSHDGEDITLETGTEVEISFLINEPFIGKVTIPSTIVADLYGGLDASSSIASTDRLAEIRILGDITVPQNCEIAPGQNLVVDFKQIEAASFSANKGEAITSNKVTKTILVQCTGMADENIVYSTFKADPVDSDAMMMKVNGNDDVGIVVYDKWGQIVNVNGGSMDMDMGANNKGEENNSLTFSAAPASATGARPKPGTFEAYATITLEIKN
ncbi:TPA: fimbrial protein StgD [Citrobacter gillenii]